jgi:hypothetical protein
MPINVDVGDFARVETDRMFASFQTDAGGVDGSWASSAIEPV